MLIILPKSCPPKKWKWRWDTSCLPSKSMSPTAGGENISSDLKNGGWKILTAIQVATSFVTMVARTIYNFLLINLFEFRQTRNEAFSVSTQLRVAGDIKEHSLQCCDLGFLNENGWSHCTLSHWTGKLARENKTKDRLPWISEYDLPFPRFLNL